MKNLTYGIDLGTRSLKVVGGRKKGPVFEIHRACSLPVSTGGEPEGRILGTVPSLTEALGKAPGARFSVSGKDLIIRYTQVPPVPLWRLGLLMDFEVREMAEQAGDALASDYNILHIPGQEEGDESVMVAVVKEPFLEARFRALSQSVGEPRAAMPGSVALFNAYLNSGDLHEGEFVFLVDIGHRNLEFVLQKDGEILFARNIAAGGHMLTEAIQEAFGVSEEQAEEIKIGYGNVTPKGMASYTSGREEKVANALIGPVGQLASMIQSSLAFSRAQTKIKDLQVGRLLLSGGGANLKGLDEYLSSNLGCPVERFLPESGLDLTPLDGEEAAEFEGDPGRFAVALGLAVSGTSEGSFVLDLVPAAVEKKRDFVGRTLFLILSGVAALVFLVVHFFELSDEASELKRSSRREYAAAQRVRNQRREYDRIVDERARLERRTAELAVLTEPAYALVRAQRLVQEACPRGVWISSVTVDVDVPDARKGDAAAEARTLVTVEGEISTIDTKAEDALRSLKEGITRIDPDCRVDVVKFPSSLKPGEQHVPFAISLDLFAAPGAEAN